MSKPPPSKPTTLWLVVSPDRLLIIPNSSIAGPGFVNLRMQASDGAFEAPNDSFFRGRKNAGDCRDATAAEIATAKAKAAADGKDTAPAPPAKDAPKPTDPPRA